MTHGKNFLFCRNGKKSNSMKNQLENKIPLISFADLIKRLVLFGLDDFNIEDLVANR